MAAEHAPAAHARAGDVHITVEPPAEAPPAAKRPSAGAASAVPTPAAAAKPRCCTWQGLPLSKVRAPLQMFAALGVAVALALAPQCAAAFRNKGVWIGAQALMRRSGAAAASEQRCCDASCGDARGRGASGGSARLCAALGKRALENALRLSLRAASCFGLSLPLRAVITVSMALETNVGATSRKATLRALGTAAGGVLAVIAVSLTAAVNSGWAPGAPPGKVAAMTLLIATFGAAVQHLRSKDPARDYAYLVCLVTLVIAALGEFTIGNWRSALVSVLWRLATIAAGGAVAFAVSNVVAPEYATHSLRLMLAVILADAAELLGGTCDAYIAPSLDDAASDAGSASSPRRPSLDAPGSPRRPSVSAQGSPRSVDGGSPPPPPRRFSRLSAVVKLSLTRAAPGFSGVAGEGGGDAGLELEHAALHSVEARLSKALERLTTLAAHAAEERRVRLGDGISVRRFAAAGAAARAVFTGAVSLLHGMESGLHLCGLCAMHAPHIRAARAEMAAAFAVAGRLATGDAAVDEAEAALAKFEAAVAALAADVTAEVSWRHLLGPDGGGEGADAALRHNVQALGAVCFALGDAARQLSRIVSELDPDAAAKKASKAARSSDDSTHHGTDETALVSAPGGAAPASGGGTMGKALRGAAHALDDALHSYLSVRHALPRQQTMPIKRK